MSEMSYRNFYFHMLSLEKNFRKLSQKKIDGEITLALVMILDYLNANGSCGQKELTVSFNSSSAAMAVSIAKLHEYGYIDKIPDTADKRNNIISLTKQGAEYLSGLEEREKLRGIQPGTDAFSEEEFLQLKNLQNKLFSTMRPYLKND